MDSKSFLQPRNLERYSFLWSQTRLVIAAAALLIGGVPPIYLIARTSAMVTLVAPLLKLAWVISGVASAYMLYRWNANRQVIFGGKVQKDTIVFFVSVVSGLNLGITGLTGLNPGMSLMRGSIVFLFVALVYLYACIYLQKRWKANGMKIF